jgi:hypothetical protein
MATDWRSMCDADRMKIDGDAIIVSFDNGRHHRIQVVETPDTLEIQATVARNAAIRDVPDLASRIWRHNRAAQLVSFRLDARHRVAAQGWVPKVGLTAEEFQLVVHRVAAESDRFEFILTGRDVE